jgi:hypothetical protein
MQTERCGSCRFWGKKPDGSPIINDGQPETGEFRSCGKIEHDDYNRSDPNPDLAFLDDDDDIIEMNAKRAALGDAVTVDGSGYYAALKTRDQFGCVFHEPTKE